MKLTREMTPCAQNRGVLQPVVPEPGVHPVDEIDILNALSDPQAMVVAMRDTNDRVKGAIPSSVGMPDTEVASRLSELGCNNEAGQWSCGAAKKIGILQWPRVPTKSHRYR